MSELDAIGEVVTGSMLGRVVEPKAGEVGADGHTHEATCLNCGTALAGDFCHACGQHAHVHRTLGAFFHDLLHGVLHFEGKTWRTLPMLAWRPGILTRRYIDGERAKFVSPMALFLFSVFIMFAVSSLTHTFESPGSTTALNDIDASIAKAEQAVRALETEKNKALAEHQPEGDVDEKLRDAKNDLAMLQGLKGEGVEGTDAESPDDKMPGWARSAVTKLQENPELAFYKVKSSAYKFSWALIPISVPFLWLLFPFSRRFRLYDHTVFVTYSLAFMSLLLVGGMLLTVAGLEGAASFLLLVPPVHFYRQLKQSYSLSRFAALWRTAALTVFSGVALLLFVVALAGANLSG